MNDNIRKGWDYFVKKWGDAGKRRAKNVLKDVEQSDMIFKAAEDRGGVK